MQAGLGGCRTCEVLAARRSYVHVAKLDKSTFSHTSRRLSESTSYHVPLQDRTRTARSNVVIETACRNSEGRRYKSVLSISNPDLELDRYPQREQPLIVAASEKIE